MANPSPELFFNRAVDEVSSHSSRISSGFVLELPGSRVPFVDATTPTKRVFYSLAGLTAATDRTQTMPDCSGLNLVHQFARVDTATTLVDDNTAQAMFASANDALTVKAGESYRFRTVVRMTTGASAQTVSFLFGGVTTTFTTCNYIAYGIQAASGTAVAPVMQNGEAATAVVVVASGTGVNKRFHIEGEFEINAGGTLIPQVQLSGATSGTVTVNVGTFFECWMLGQNPVTALGAWA